MKALKGKASFSLVKVDDDGTAEMRKSKFKYKKLDDFKLGSSIPVGVVISGCMININALHKDNVIVLYCERLGAVHLTFVEEGAQFGALIPFRWVVDKTKKEPTEAKGEEIMAEKKAKSMEDMLKGIIDTTKAPIKPAGVQTAADGPAPPPAPAATVKTTKLPPPAGVQTELAAKGAPPADVPPVITEENTETKDKLDAKFDKEAETPDKKEQAAIPTREDIINVARELCE